MPPSIETLVEALCAASRDLAGEEQLHEAAKKALAESASRLDLAKRRRLSAEQAVKEAIRIRVGGPGELF